MKTISDDFLLMTAQVAATLIGLVAVGMFFYIESALQHLTITRAVVEPVIRAMSKQIFLLFSLALALAVGLLVMSTGWLKALFLVISFYLVVSTIQFIYRTVNQRKVFGKIPGGWPLLVTTSVWIVLIVAIPWILGGTNPTRNDFTWSLLLAGIFGFMNLIGLLLSGFDIKREEEELLAAQAQADRSRRKK